MSRLGDQMWLITTDKRLINNGLTVSGNTVYTLKIHRSKLADVFLSWSYLHEKAKVRKFGRFLSNEEIKHPTVVFRANNCSCPL